MKMFLMLATKEKTSVCFLYFEMFFLGLTLFDKNFDILHWVIYNLSVFYTALNFELILLN